MSYHADEHVLVIGAAGFIGGAIVDMLEATKSNWSSIDIRPLTDQRLSDHHSICDICDYDWLAAVYREISPTIVIVLAARTDISAERVGGYGTNIQGTLNLIRVMNNCDSTRRSIFTSTQLVRGVGNISQDIWSYDPDTTYGDSKVLTEISVRSMLSERIEWVIVRPTTVWGPRCSDHYLSLIKFIERGMYFHSGSRDYKKSFGYVRNIAYQYLKIGQAPREQVNHKAFYLSDYCSVGIRSFCDHIRAGLGARFIPVVPVVLCHFLAFLSDCLSQLGIFIPYNSFRLKNITTEYEFDLDATEKVCGPLPFTLEAGMKEYLDWYANERSP